MRCAWCRHALDDVHGHGACLNNRCPMFGLNQAECCSGDTAEAGWVPTSDLAAAAGDTDEPAPEEAPPGAAASPQRRPDAPACPKRPSSGEPPSR